VAEEFIAELEATGKEMFESKVLSPADVTYAEAANGFLTLQKDSLPVLVAARLKTAVHILLFNVNGIKAARKWVLQENTRRAIMYLLSFFVPGDNMHGDKMHYYIGESKRSGCTHLQLCTGRWSQHSCDLACDEHCNGKLQDAYRSASHPWPAHGRIASSPPHSPAVPGRGMEWRYALARAHLFALLRQRLRLASGTRLPAPER
jgi:hypothetical protein